MTQEVEQTQEDSNAAFDAGFNQTRGIDAPVVEKSVEQVEATPTEEVKPPVEPDLKAEIASLREKVSVLDKLPEQLRNIHGHIGNLNSQLRTALATAKAVESTGGEAPTKEQLESASSSTSRWKQLKEDFPDWADALDERFAALQAAMPKAFDPQGLKSELDTTVTQRIDQSVATARQLAVVDMKHPDWEETVKTPQFEAWHAKQAPEIQALAKSSSAKDAVRMLDAFKADSAKAVKDKQQKDANQARLKAAVTPQGRATPPEKTIDDDAAFDAGFKSVRG